MRESTRLPLEFRPTAGLRLASTFLAAVCGFAAFANVLTVFRSGSVLRLGAAAVLLAAFLLALGVLRRKLIVDEDGLYVASLSRRFRIPWAEVLAIEQTRQSFVIITEWGDVSAGWIAPNTRDLLFRKTLELAKLSMEPKEQRWGIRARFVRTETPGVIRREALLRKQKPDQEHHG